MRRIVASIAAAPAKFGSKFLKIFAKFGKILAFFRKKCDFRAMQRSALCRSRRELSNAYLLAKFGFDTAENEPYQVWPIFGLAGAAVVAGPRVPRHLGDKQANQK